jgi:hypothetical protein
MEAGSFDKGSNHSIVLASNLYLCNLRPKAFRTQPYFVLNNRIEGVCIRWRKLSINAIALFK